ncbi:acetyl-CoA carboxylase biotin carboxyl carrier protein subunit [Sporosarcina sp. P37]|uniref:acetyl-CoA carboxylase biotin carboxyl carrier protein subunit n=1 Tax=unclassified Sporosarcina TaxID=2647733 RepID=UPI0009C0349E|nr:MULTISPECIES: acetyl-CoA carboxylase biotin carboxyl carrier protein subunit [unclassified Sporosarcina]ARD49205.1 acetyl-CoA carboxylase biotin carboxyl carrier protein subunit [Sporosarcina sp. P33]ARK25680.1 acetyl-CoA carboxylase biotin carboxyl carrier protein subunit [Sporosarcina sp. P37]PID19298.1 acetyl-CoA carboxylase biotin carboxyl carrier protein subunit [Sporosarcina sp. P35]
MQEVKASMAGTIFSIEVKEGDAVTKGQVVIILESMKMEIPLEAEMDGTVSKIHGAEGDFVDEEDVLVTIQS